MILLPSNQGINPGLTLGSISLASKSFFLLS